MKVALLLGGATVAGVVAWQIGARLSTDAVSMAIGLVFGVMAGVPAALLVLSAGQRTGGEDSYRAGYDAGVRDVTALARGTRPQLVDGTLAPRYTHAHPFGPPAMLQDAERRYLVQWEAEEEN